MNDEAKKIGPFALFFVIIELIVIISLVVVIVDRVRVNNEIRKNEDSLYDLEITNFRQIFKDIDKKSMKDIVFSVHDAVWLSEKIISEKVEAIIQKDSVVKTYYENDDIYQLSFLVDVPSINQSYNVLHYYSDSSYNKKLSPNFRTVVYCQTDSTGCKDRYAGKVKLILNNLDYK